VTYARVASRDNVWTLNVNVLRSSRVLPVLYHFSLVLLVICFLCKIFLALLTMPYRSVSVDIKRAAVRMTLKFDFAVPDVASLLNISPDTIRRAIRQHNETGDVVKLEKGAKRGRKKILDEDDLKVLSQCTIIVAI
jgi:transposase-like protein